MQSTSLQPVILSVVQYQDALADGSMRIPDIIQKARELGMDGIELRPGHWLKEEELSALREHLEELGLLVTYATFSTLFNDTTEGERQLRRDIETAHVLGSPQLRVFQGPMPVEDTGWDAARAAIDYAGSLGVVIALENFSDMPGGTSAEIKHVLDAIPTPSLGTNIDIGNYAKLGEDVVQAIGAVGTRAVSTHLKDITTPPAATPTFLGNGMLPLDAILDAFARLPQRIIHGFEFEGGENPEERIIKSLRYLRERAGRL